MSHPCNSKSPKAKDKKYMCNPESGRWVLIDGKIGKNIKPPTIKPKSPVKPPTVKLKSPTKPIKTNSPGKVFKTWNCFKNSMVELKPHQINFAKRFISSNIHGVIAVHSLGSGKTLTAITTSQCYLNKYPNDKVIVITPASLIKNFQHEMEKWGVQNIEKYEFFTFDSFKNSPISCKNSLLIVDEVHNLRTKIKLDDKSKKSIGKTKTKGKKSPSDSKKKSTGLKVAEIINCAKQAKRVLMLTGTPIVNDMYDIENLMAMSYGRNPLTKTEFLKMASNPKVFENYFKCRISFFNAAQEHFPTSKVHDIYFKMSQQYYKNYKLIEENQGFNEKWMSGGDLTIFYNGVRQASNSLFLEDTNSPKIDWIINKIKHSEVADKFVVFSHFLNAGSELLSKELQKHHIKYHAISGTTTKTKRAQYVNDYNANKVKVLFITKAGGEGLNLLETNSIILMEPAWNETTVKQVIGRAIRFKSHDNLPIEKRHVDIYKLYTIKPDEDKVKFKILASKPSTKFAEMLSIDLYLKKFSYDKQSKIEKFINYLKAFKTLEKCV